MVKMLKKLLSCILVLSLVMSMVCMTALAETEPESGGSATTLEELVAALPEEVTADNAAEVKQQLEVILAALAADESGEDPLDSETMSRLGQLQADAEKALTPDEPSGEPVNPDLNEGNTGVAPAAEGDELDPVESPITTAEALNAALADTAVTKILLGEITLDSPVAINRDITLSGGAINGTVTVGAGVKLTIDGVTITATAGPGIAVNGMNVTLEVKGENSVTSIQPETGPVGFAGVEVPMNTSLTITGDGTLNATAGGGAGVGGSCAGGIGKWLNGEITVSMIDGTLNATGAKARPDQGAYGGAGIGSASYYSTKDAAGQRPGTITIIEGTIHAQGVEGGAGIGGGFNVDSGKIVIQGGDITAQGSSGAGIGSGMGMSDYGAYTAEVEIGGGIIKAIGGWLSAGIGGGFLGSAKVTITGGNITAVGQGRVGDPEIDTKWRYQGGPGIGGGYQGYGLVNISGGTINATGGNSAPGIGNGPVTTKVLTQTNSGVVAVDKDTSGVNISGGIITAQGGCNAAGIGGGNCTPAVKVEITGGAVDAKGGDGMPGIGSGVKVDPNKTKYPAETTGIITIGSGVNLTDGTTIGAPAGNKYYECTERPDGTRVYTTTEHPADTVALLITGETKTPYSDLAQAVAAAKEGDTVRLVSDVTLARGAEIKNKEGKVTGYQPSLTVNKAITLDLNGKTIYAGSSIQTDGAGVIITSMAAEKGTISYGADLGNIISANGAKLAELSNLVLDGNGTAPTGIGMPGSGRTIALIQNCEIKNVKVGIALYKVRTGMIQAIDKEAPAIQKMNNVTIQAADLGMEIYMSECALIENCTITGGKALVVKGNNGDPGYPTSANIKGGHLTGTAGPAVEISDVNWWAGSAWELTIKAEINGTALSGKDGVLMESVEREQTVGKVKFETTAVNTNAVCYLTEDVGAAEGGKKIFYATYAEALAKSKTITVLETNADPGSYTMSENETITVIGADIRDKLTVPTGGYRLDVETQTEEGVTAYTYSAVVCTHENETSEVTIPANYGVEGVMTYTCTACGATRTEAIPALVYPYVPVTTYTLTITYVNPDGTANTVTQNVTANGAYSVASPVIEGYTADPAVVSGVMTGDLAVTVTYTANETDIGDDNPPLVETPDDPGTDIGDDNPPTSETPDGSGTDIGDDNPPTSETPATDVPKTGDRTVIWLALAAVSALGLAGLHLAGKRKENEA